MSVTLKKLGINLAYFPRDQEEEAIQAVSQLRMEQFLMGEGQKFNWSVFHSKPELIDLNDKTQKNSIFQSRINQDDDDDDFWPYANNSLYLFPKNSPFRVKLYKLMRQMEIKYFLQALAILNVIAFCIYDFSTRIYQTYPQINRASVSIEIICNIIFGIEIGFMIIIQGFIFGKNTYMKNTWNWTNFLSFVMTWVVLKDQEEITDTAEFDIVLICRVIRLLRNFKFVQELPILRHQLESYFGSFPKLKTILIPLVFVMLFYCIIGIHLFSGLTEYRCRKTPEPVDGKWESDPEIQFLCGIWKCPEELTCGNPADYGIERDWHESDILPFSFNLNRFDDFFYSLFVVFTFLNVTGWSGTTFSYWKAMTTYATAFYFVTMIFILAYVLSNLLLATFYESFMEHSSIKQNNKAKQEEAELENEIQKKRQQQMMDRLANLGDNKQKGEKQKISQKMSLYFQDDDQPSHLQSFSQKLAKSIYFVTLNSLTITLCSIVICIDYHGIPKRIWNPIQVIDTVCTFYFFVELLINLWGKGFKSYLKKNVNQLDTVVILTQLGLYFYIFLEEVPLVFNENENIQFVKSLKIIRIIKLLYAAKLFHTISVLSRCLFQTLLKMKEIILLWLFMVLALTIVGRELFSYRGRFIEEEDGFVAIAQDPRQGKPVSVHFEDFGSSLSAIFFIFYNEEWHVSMYWFARTFRASSMIFHVVAIIMGQILLIRLLQAIFLNEFGKQLIHINAQVKPVSQHKQVKQIVQVFQAIIKLKKKKVSKDQNKVEIPENTPENLQNKNENLKNSAVAFLNKQSEKANSNQQQIEQKEENNQLISDNQEIGQNKQINEPEVEIIKNPESEDEDKSLYIFSRNSKIRRSLFALVDSNYTTFFTALVTIATQVRISLMTSLHDPNSDQSEALQILFIVITCYFSIMIIFGFIAYGFKKYLTSNIYNLLNFAITIFEIITLLIDTDHFVGKIITSLRVLEFIYFGSKFSSEIAYAQIALMNAFQQMAQLIIFCVFILIIFGVFSLKLMKGKLYHCTTLSEELEESIKTKQDCMDYGGSWVNQILTYDNIFMSVCILFVTATTEAWLPILEYTWSAVGVDRQPIENNNRWWTVYFQVYFFIGNLCMLNMFIGLIVNAYTDGKMKASKMDLLDENQREWLQIKLQIFKLQPIIKSIHPKEGFKKILFFIIKNKKFKIFWLVIIFANTVILSLYYHRQDPTFRQTLDQINTVFIGIFTFEILVRFCAKEFRIFIKDKMNVLDLFCIWFCIANLVVRNDQDINFYFRRIFNSCCVAYQLVRNFKIVKRFNVIEKLFNSIFSVIPSALSMLYIMIIFLYIYTNWGVNQWGYLRTQEKINGFDLHFRKFTTAMFSLVRVASSEEWWDLLWDCAHTQEPDFHCIDIQSYEQYAELGFNSCGSKVAFFYYISFHLIFSLMILNVFIASVLGAYDEHVKQEESAISKYQLNDVMYLWSQYDPRGLGFINYKLFWKLSSQIAIIFGVDQADLLDVNNKKNFLKVLSIPIYELKGSDMLCYQFHDVILSLTRISVILKYGVTNLDPTDDSIIQQIKETHGHILHNEKQSGKFHATAYTSGDMVAIIYIQKKIRGLRKRMQNKGKNVIGELGDINNLLKKDQQ